MASTKQLKKSWVTSSASDPDLPANVKIGYYQDHKFHCNCGSIISERGVTPHFNSQKHHRWIECQNKVLGCRGGSCDFSIVLSPRRHGSPMSPRSPRSPKR